MEGGAGGHLHPRNRLGLVETHECPRVLVLGTKLVNNLRADDIPYHHQTIMQIKDLLHDPGVVDGVSLMRVLIRKSQFDEMQAVLPIRTRPANRASIGWASGRKRGCAK